MRAVQQPRHHNKGGRVRGVRHAALCDSPHLNTSADSTNSYAHGAADHVARRPSLLSATAPEPPAVPRCTQSARRTRCATHSLRDALADVALKAHIAIKARFALRPAFSLRHTRRRERQRTTPVSAVGAPRWPTASAWAAGRPQRPGARTTDGPRRLTRGASFPHSRTPESVR